ncbi:unnamed protein product [Parnassius apollo]|uniref:(apollo) hypothetical protein n=1 Tax=Parnassius apollo TaxID=110799 RepID=A0A8S3W3R3_PARAO|nr:unnamed protein product [Parnassius apollo]
MDTWTKVKTKKLRNIGAQPQKCMRDPCACKLKCFETIQHEDRLNLFEYFWATGCYETQWHFILNSTEIKEPKVIKIKKDNCKICSEYENTTEEAKLQLQQLYETY